MRLLLMCERVNDYRILLACHTFINVILACLSCPLTGTPFGNV